MGGLFDGLKYLFSLVLALLTYRRYDTYMVANLFQYEVPDSKDGQQGGEKGNKIKKALTNFFVGRLNTESLNPKKVSSLKMLFFDYLPRSLRSSFNRTRFRLLQRTDHYRHFEAGQKDY